MTMAPVHSRFSRKTLAIALAASVSFGGVQIVGPEMGLNTVAEASAAELDPSVVTKTELVSNKSGQSILGMTVEATQEAYDAFYDTHGNDFTLKLDFKIPDDAQPGDTIVIRKGGINGSFRISGVVNAPTDDGRKVGSLQVDPTKATFTVSDQIADTINRTASFEIPFNIPKTSRQITTSNEEQDGQPAPDRDMFFSSEPGSTLIFKRVYQYRAPNIRISDDGEDSPNNNATSFSPVNLDTGTTTAHLTHDIGHANYSASNDGTYVLDPSAETRNVTIRYTIDDKDGRVFATTAQPGLYVYKFSPKKLKSVNSDELAVDGEDSYLYRMVKDKTFNTTVTQIDKQTLDVTIHNIPPEYSVRAHAEEILAESPYSPGKTVTLTSEFVNGVGEPHSAYDKDYLKTNIRTYTHPAFAGYGSADDIKRDITMSAKVNGQDADDVNSAQQVKDGKAQFSIDLKNNGNIGASSATVTYPKGVTGPNGETEKFIDFGPDGFPAGSAKTLDLGELNVPEGTNENKFIVTMTGYPELTDAAWTATGPTGPTDIYVDNVVKQPNGDYLVTRNDGEDWTIELSTIIDRINELEKKESPSKEEFDAVKDDLDKIKDDINDLKGADDEINNKIDELNKDVDDLDDRVSDLENRVTDLENNGIKEVRDNGDGTYTLIRNDGSEVLGNIDTSGSITTIVSDGKGNLIVTTVDGNTTTVPVDQITITESNKGTPDHTVTITTPDGQSVTFNVFDVYVVDVEKQADGNYKIIRNDGTEWVINLKDIRDKITALEAKDSPSRDEFNAVKNNIDDLKKEIDNLKAADEAIKGDINQLRADITTINNRLITIEARLTVVENNTNDLTKCVAGAGMVGIPAMLAIPLMFMTQLNIPGLKDLNNQVQKQLGMYNPELAQQWKRNGGVLQAGAALATLAGIIGGIAYLAQQCDSMMQTDAAKDTDLGQLSSKLDEGSTKIKEGSSAKKDGEAETPAEQPAE